MEIEQYICPNCNVRLRKSIWEKVYSNYINGSLVVFYEGICRSCRKKFSFFVDNSINTSMFWEKSDEEIFLENAKLKGFCNSVNILYATRKKQFKNNIDVYEKKPKLSKSFIIVPQDFSDLINKYDLRKNHNILFIDRNILETKFNQDYPCILAEKNIIELAKKWSKYKLYSDTETYFNFFNLGE